MNNETVKAIWQEVFPASAIYPSKAYFGDSIYFKCTLAKDKSEVYNGILENDALSYMFEIDGNKYNECHLSIYIKPDSQYLCYSRRTIRKKNIKNVNDEKLRARFLQVKQLIIDNKNNFKDLLFNINNKI